MRILEALGEPISFGGEEAYIRGLISHMDDDLEVDLLTPYYCDNEAFRAEVCSRGGRVTCLEVPFRPGHARWREYGPIKSYLEKNRYDVIHIHSGSNTMLAMYAALARREGIPRIIVHSHCSGIPGLKHTAAKFVTSPMLNRYPTDFCACSRQAAEWRFAGRAAKEVRILRNGIDCSRYAYKPETRQRLREEYGIDDSRTVIGCTGRLSAQKNQAFLLRLLHELDDSFVLLLVGEGEDRAMLERMTSELGLADRVIMTGAVDNPNDYMNMMDVFLLPSIYEGFALVSIEAQSNGLRVIASENIPKDTRLTSGIEYYSLEDTSAWISELERGGFERDSRQIDLVLESGYDVADTAEAVCRLYRGEVYER